MLSPIIRRPRRSEDPHHNERGVTIALVAVAMVSIIAMAALSIDIGTFYTARAEAQRAADAAALAAARVISISGITGDPTNLTSSWGPVCDGASSAATLTANAVAGVQQNFVGGLVPNTINVYYGAGSAGATSSTCVGVSNFAINPVVKVTVTRTNLPIFFGRIFSLTGASYGGTTVSANASAEAFNPSNSGSVAANMVPVQPRCVKPWIIPNLDTNNTTAPHQFVSPADGSVSNPGVKQLGQGVIGETFTLTADCAAGVVNGCTLPQNPPTWAGGNLEYVPALVQGTPGAARSCATANTFQEATAGCDETTVYTCGTPSVDPGATQLDRQENPALPTEAAGDTSTAAQCLINQANGQDTIDTTTFPFQIKAGSGSALAQAGVVNANDVITTSNSIVTLPIYDGTNITTGVLHPTVTIVGFLQVFINNIDSNGRPNVTVLNVAGCSNAAAGNAFVTGTSPVPVRLITPP